AGYYDYDTERRPSPSQVTAGVIADVTGAEPRTMGAEEIVRRLIAPMINEAVAILEENHAQRPSDVDVVWLHGYGWPADKGGPMFYGDVIGAGEVLSAMEGLVRDDPRIRPADTLRRLAQDGGRFTELDLGGLKTRRTKGDPS
uniref:3-hydroxyacyl-CoA dehydrogenase family protein n=1 Tax=Acuticoccus sp. TaxID=1904378 RepID=UPI003B52165A